MLVPIVIKNSSTAKLSLYNSVQHHLLNIKEYILSNLGFPR